MFWKKSLIAGVASVGLACAASAQESDAVTFTFDVDEQALMAATSSDELVAALRDTTRITMAQPLESYLWVDFRGYVGDPQGRGQLAHLLLASIRVALKEGQAIEAFSFSDAVRESHGDDFPDDGDIWDEQDTDNWTEEEAWDILVGAIDSGLPGTSETFGPLPDGQHQKFRVTGVEVREFDVRGEEARAFFECCYDDVSGPTLMLKPELTWDTYNVPADASLRYRLDVLLIGLEATEPPAEPPAPDARDAARQLAGMGCSQITAGGEAEITVDGETLKGGAVYMRGPDGQVVAMIGSVGDEGPEWCLTVFSARPVDGRDRHAITDPGTLLGTREGMTVAMLDLRGDQASFFATGGHVLLDVADVIAGRLDLQGVLSAPDRGFQNPDGREISITGWFDAEKK